MKKRKDNFGEDTQPENTVTRSHIFKPDPRQWETDDSFQSSSKNPRSIYDLYRHCKENKNVEVDALVLCGNSKGKFSTKRLKNREEFIEAFENGGKGVKFKESYDAFAMDADYTTGTLVGQDYVPLLGGPFNKQLYIYDALKMFSQCFFAYNHDPVAKAIVHITRDFTLGRGFRVDSENKTALSIWRAFEEVNNLETQFETLSCELSVNGEQMLWWLPDNQTKIQYNIRPGQEAPKGLIPRVRFIDPSTCWEIVTYPEDITRVLTYNLVFPTQYQIYSGRDKDQPVPSSKFIIQQIPADQVDHFKINCFSNEKRGRSDLYPVLGYLKRLRDSVNYSIIALQKSAAWAIDTTIEGSQSDIDNYISDQQSQGTIAPAGSEFVHSKKIERKYLSNSATSQGSSGSGFDWCLSMIAAGVQIPVNYFGSHLSGGSTRASALVATEPVAKKFQQRQLVLERIVHTMWDRVMKRFGIEADCEVTFPEVIVQDRSQKIKDLILAEQQGYISKERAATITAKELGISEYEYANEQEQIASDKPDLLDVMSDPLSSKPTNPEAVEDEEKGKPKTAFDSKTRRDVSVTKGMG